MKVTVNNKEEKEIQLPCLMESKENKVIYLITNHKEGTIYTGVYLTGAWKGGISDDIDWELLKPFNGEITLSND